MHIYLLSHNSYKQEIPGKSSFINLFSSFFDISLFWLDQLLLEPKETKHVKFVVFNKHDITLIK